MFFYRNNWGSYFKFVCDNNACAWWWHEVALLLFALVVDGSLCLEGSLDPKKVNGKLLVCLRGSSGRVEKGLEASLAGAAGMILCNDQKTGNDINADAHLLLASHLNYTNGLAFFSDMKSTNDPQGRLVGPVAEHKNNQAPVMAPFPSRGPNKITPEILKPDITAPRVSVIAAYTEGKQLVNNCTTPFYLESGTSMSCPHVSGIVGLLKKLHPD
ncbi:hypothetical protein ACSBR2_016384 [Camellia fascicularis]